MTERTRLISYLCPFLRYSLKEYKKNTGSNFPHLLARATPFFVAHTKEVVFLLVIENSCTLSIFSVDFAHAHVVLVTTQKGRRAEKIFHNARSLQENNARSAANQSARTIVAI